MPFFRSVAGLRVSLVLWSALLVVNVVTWAVGPADVRTRVLITIPEVLGIVVTLLQLHRVTRAADGVPTGDQARASAR